MRLLLATEGPSEDSIGVMLSRHLFAPTATDPELLIEPKRFPARGISVVLRSLPNVSDAAHFSYYDVLVVQFDLDGTIDLRVSADYSKSSRWQDIKKGISERLLNARKIPRVRPVQIALLAGCQSTDAWLCWANEGGDPQKWESMDRSLCKEQLYGKPPRGIVAKSEGYTKKLLAKMDAETKWPGSLRFFADQMKSAFAACR